MKMTEQKLACLIGDLLYNHFSSLANRAQLDSLTEPLDDHYGVEVNKLEVVVELGEDSFLVCCNKQ